MNFAKFSFENGVSEAFYYLDLMLQKQYKPEEYVVRLQKMYNLTKDDAERVQLHIEQMADSTLTLIEEMM